MSNLEDALEFQCNDTGRHLREGYSFSFTRGYITDRYKILKFLNDEGRCKVIHQRFKSKTSINKNKQNYHCNAIFGLQNLKIHRNIINPNFFNYVQAEKEI